MPTSTEDLFDAKLRATLGTPPSWEQTARDETAEASPHPWRAIAAALLVTVGLAAAMQYWLGSPATPPNEHVTSEVLPDEQDQDKQDKRDKPDQDKTPTGELVQQLANPKTVDRARRTLIGRGKTVVPILIKKLRQLDPEKSRGHTHAILITLGGLRGEARDALAPVAKLLVNWPAEACVDIFEFHMTMALWVPVSFTTKSLTFDHVKLSGGRQIPTGGELTNQIMEIMRRQRGRKKVFEANLQDGLAGVRESLSDSAAGTRDAALDYLVAMDPAPTNATCIALEKILLLEQPKFSHNRFMDRQSIQTDQRDSHATLRGKAARLLIDRAPTTPQAASAFAWRLRQDKLPTQRRRAAALSIGQLLAGDKIDNQVRHSKAAEALLYAAKGKDAAVAGEAITVLGQLGSAALRYLPELKALTKHANEQVAKRAQATYRSLRRLLDGK